jgi:hypothetical protein
MLDNHPRIHCGPEMKFFRDFHGDFIEPGDKASHLRFIATARTFVSEAALFGILGAAFLEVHEQAARDARKPRWADKAPENVVYLADWERLLGDRWVFLHVVRNPLDTIASIDEIGLPRLIPTDLDGRIEFYLRYLRAGLAFADRHPDRYVRLLYDDLVERPEPAMREVMERLGEELDPAQLDLDIKPSQRGLEDLKVHHTSAVHDGSVGRWRKRLTEQEARRIVAATRADWSRLDPDNRWPLPDNPELAVG